jgi:nucleotide-binding universal stress UspA family protein
VFERILVPLDGSAAAEAALAFAELIPSRTVRLLTVEPDAAGPMLASAPEVEAWREARRVEGQAYLERAGEGLRRQGREVETEVAFGDPAEQIVGAAAAVDLVMMGSHGRGAGGRVAYGSVADRVARHAPAPVLVVRGGTQPAALPPLTRVVVPLDGSARAEAALPTATALADLLGVPVHLVRVLEEDVLRATVQAGAAAAAAYAAAQEATRRQADAYLADEARRLRDQDVAAGTELRTGQPAPELLAALRPGDLVVLTPHGRGGVRRWLLGSVAEKLVRLAPAPVLLVRNG